MNLVRAGRDVGAAHAQPVHGYVQNGGGGRAEAAVPVVLSLPAARRVARGEKIN